MNWGIRLYDRKNLGVQAMPFGSEFLEISAAIRADLLAWPDPRQETGHNGIECKRRRQEMVMQAGDSRFAEAGNIQKKIPATHGLEVRLAFAWAQCKLYDVWFSASTTQKQMA